MTGMDITPELAQRVLRGGPDAIAVVRGIYQTQIQKLDDIETKARQIQEAAEMLPLRWIPVSERLPEDGEWVWCYGPNRGCEVACISKYWDGWVSSDKKNLVAGAYTHWMPLPEPPECP